MDTPLPSPEIFNQDNLGLRIESLERYLEAFANGEPTENIDMEEYYAFASEASKNEILFEDAVKILHLLIRYAVISGDRRGLKNIIAFNKSELN